MAGTSVTLNKQQKDDLVKLLRDIDKGAERAQRTAINRTINGVKALASKEMRATVTLKAETIKDNISDKKATLNKLTGQVSIKSKPIPSFKFTNRKLKNGVSIKIFKADGTTRMRHAFYATMSNGHVGIFMRDPAGSKKHKKRNPRREPRPNVWGSTQLAITELFGPSLTTLYEKTPGLGNKIEKEAADRLERELSSQIDYLLGLNNDKHD